MHACGLRCKALWASSPLPCCHPLHRARKPVRAWTALAWGNVRLRFWHLRACMLAGFTSNRSRQNVASFLTKALGIDWRWGEPRTRACVLFCHSASFSCGWLESTSQRQEGEGLPLVRLRAHPPHPAPGRLLHPCLAMSVPIMVACSSPDPAHRRRVQEASLASVKCVCVCACVCAGAALFECLLVDHDVALNIGNWAYQAG